MIVAPLVAAALIAQSAGLSAGVSATSERTRFRFENPSSFDTAQLVPHFFEQKYRPPALGVFVEATYGHAERRSSTRVTIRPRAHTRGSDIDTFFQPSGDVATSGTDGPITYGGFAVEQRVVSGIFHGWQVGATGGYRRDRSEFLPDDRVVTHTQPRSVTRTFITDRETTIAQVLQVGALASRSRAAGRWHSQFDLAVQPVVSARLLIRLPDKYPGVDLVFAALGFGGDASWTIERSGRWRAGVTIVASGARGYRAASEYAAHAIGVRFFAGAGAR